MEKLNCESLMIGDWVIYRGEPTIVYEIDDYYKRINTEPDGYNSIKCIDTSEIEPIPLTPEILETNGFRLEWDGDIKLMVCDGVVIEIGDNYKRYKDGKMYLRRVFAPLYYVHELQHALRLCGIEKEIIL